MSSAPRFDGWLERFFADYYQARPVNATFIGVHEHDHRLPACSEDDLGDQLAGGERLLAELAALPEEPLTAARRTDRRLAEGHLRVERWELLNSHFQRGNPAFYSGEAVFGALSLFLRDFAPLPERLEAATARLRDTPRLLAEGRSNVRAAPAAWTAAAMRDCDGGLAFLRDGVPLLCAEHGIDDTGFFAAAEAASDALAEHQEWLARELALRDTGAYAAGAEALALYVAEGHQLPCTSEEIVANARDQLAEHQARLTEGAARFGAADWPSALARLHDLHPSAGAYYRRYGEVWDAARAAALEHDLLTWPEYPIRYVPRPSWARAAAPHLYFLFYRSPAAFDAIKIVDYLVEPLDPEWPAERQEQLLRAVNDSVIKLNHVVHHGGIGHHVQNWHAFRAGSRIGRIAAVDCAARIALFCGGTMAEGWSSYTTELMGEVGFLGELEAYSLHHQRVRMAARAIVDVELHTGRMSLDEAAAFYQVEAGMSEGAARAEAVKNSMFPGAALMYLVGADLIRDLRRELSSRAGFTLQGFHDTFLAYGSIPVAMIAEDMRTIFPQGGGRNETARSSATGPS